MANYTKSTNFLAKDSLASGDPAKIIKGSEFDVEFNALQTAVNSKAIPAGWLLCNGTSGTPDLRNRFVVGAGSTYAVAATGGSADAIVVSHTHTVTDSGHSHTTGTTGNSYLGDVSGGGGRTHPSGSSANVTSTSTTGISINTSGSSGTNANLPPYYALAYIMKS